MSSVDADDELFAPIAGKLHLKLASVIRLRPRPPCFLHNAGRHNCALDLRVANAGYLAGAGPGLRAFFLDRGLLVRPLGNVIQVLPPYCVTTHELDRLYAALDEATQLASDGR